MTTSSKTTADRVRHYVFNSVTGSVTFGKSYGELSYNGIPLPIASQAATAPTAKHTSGDSTIDQIRIRIKSGTGHVIGAPSAQKIIVHGSKGSPDALQVKIKPIGYTFTLVKGDQERVQVKSYVDKVVVSPNVYIFKSQPHGVAIQEGKVKKKPLLNKSKHWQRLSNKESLHP